MPTYPDGTLLTAVPILHGAPHVHGGPTLTPINYTSSWPTAPVYVIQSAQRRLLPDLATAETLLGSPLGPIHLILDTSLNQIPNGPPIPSIVTEGALFHSNIGSEIDVFQGGWLHYVPDMATFYDNDFNPADVKPISDAALKGIPRGAALMASKRFEFTADVNLGSGHFMRTSGYVSTKTGNIRGSINARTITLLGGFRGGGQIFFVDGTDIIIGCSQMVTVGVDGAWIGNHDRTNPWQETMDLAIVNRTKNIYVSLTWEPEYLQGLVQTAVDRGTPIADMLSQIVGASKTSGPTGPKQ